MGGKTLVLVTDAISEKARQLSREYLAAGADIVFCNNAEDVDKYIASADVLVCSTRGISSELLARAKRCVFIQKLGAGVNTVAIGEATKRGIPVGYTPGQNACSVAEHAVMLMLALYRHVVMAHNKIVGEGRWMKSVLRDMSYELSHKKVGIIGFGNVGRLVAKLLRGFECEIIYYDVYRLSTEKEKQLGVTYADVDTLVKDADVVSLHAPLTAQTKHLMNESRLKAMKPAAILINTGRGELVDDQALIEVLTSGHLLGAGIDVFEREPIDQNHPLAKLEKVVLTPHIGGMTVEATESVMREAYQNINSFLLHGEITDVSNIVNLEQLVLVGK